MPDKSEEPWLEWSLSKVEDPDSTPALSSVFSSQVSGDSEKTEPVDLK